MSFRRRVLNFINPTLNRANIHILSFREYRRLAKFIPTAEDKQTFGRWEDKPVPSEAAQYLKSDNPRLAELQKRYAGHPAAARSTWSDEKLHAGLHLERFRADNPYIFQLQGGQGPQSYVLTAYYARDIDRLGLFGRLVEDASFGAYAVEFENGYLVSRDLLDSINEINVLARWFQLSHESSFEVLDIGAGYGRLAHRLVEGMKSARIACTDAIPVSTFLCEFYLRFRGIEHRATAVPLDEVDTKLLGRRFDLATNIHSFSECPISAIEWWLDCLDRLGVKNFLIVPNEFDELLSTESDGKRIRFAPLLAHRGWRPARSEPYYMSSRVAQRFALFPDCSFLLFSR